MNKIIAHRGVFDNIDVVENTIEAFKLAIKKQIPFELDVQLTKDNQLVVFHDNSLRRLANNIKIIQESNYDDIKNIKLLDQANIPLLKEVLELNNDKVTIDIEIKKTKRIKETVDLLVKELKPYTNYIIKSFDPRIVKYIHNNYSWIKCGLLIEYKYKRKWQKLLLKSSLTIKYCKPDFVAISKQLLNDKKFMNRIKNIPTYIWTITDPKDIDLKNNYTYICNNLMDKNKNI